MKKLLAIFLLVPVLALSNPLPCITGPELAGLTAEFKELPWVSGISQNGVAMVIFANPTTGSFTIIERTGVDTFCAVMTGSEFKPVPAQLQDQLKELQER